nr:MAG TPA: hypothetical protein [Caudoviricetes sp.]
MPRGISKVCRTVTRHWNISNRRALSISTPGAS